MKQKLKNIILGLCIIVLLMLIGLLGCYLYRQVLMTRQFAREYTNVYSDDFEDEIATEVVESVATDAYFEAVK